MAKKTFAYVVSITMREGAEVRSRELGDYVRESLKLVKEADKVTVIPIREDNT